MTTDGEVRDTFDWAEKADSFDPVRPIRVMVIKTLEELKGIAYQLEGNDRTELVTLVKLYLGYDDDAEILSLARTMARAQKKLA